MLPFIYDTETQPLQSGTFRSYAYMCQACSMLEHLTPHYEWGGTLKAPIHLEQPVTAYGCEGRR